MAYLGTVKGGVVVLRGDSSLPEGTEVTVAPVEASLQSGEFSDAAKEPNKLLELGRLAELKSSDLPPDLAENHDHYLHGKNHFPSICNSVI